VELPEGLRVLDHDLGRERPGLHVPSFLELEQIAAVAEHRTVRESLQQTLRHHAFLSSVDRV
jgi:hypothetical protein